VKFWIIIPAAGTGNRFSQNLPKQYQRICDKTVLEHTIARFCHDWVHQIWVAIAKDDSLFSTLQLDSKVKATLGGANRMNSVANALEAIRFHAHANDWVLVHDAARPCLHEKDLLNLVTSLQEDPVGGILGAKVQDTIKQVENDTIINTQPREQLWQASTPQMFRFHILDKALTHCLANNKLATDEAFAVEQCGFKPKIVQAQFPNPKLTLPSDQLFITMLLEQQAEELSCV
jgi:2-C-methyl-D-erythritol 4-phosphate cytidylyltransferase